MTWHHLDRRVSKLEQAQDEDHTEPQIVFRIRGEDDPPLPPGTRVLHIEVNGPSWWEVIGEEETP